MSDMLRSKPDYGENPHDGSSMEDWLKLASVDESGVSPEEDQFFESLVVSTLNHKGGAPCQLQFAVEGGETPSVNVHDVNMTPSPDPSTPSESPSMKLNQDRIVTTPPGLGRNVMSAKHKAGDLDEMATSLGNVSQQATKAVADLSKVPQVAPTQPPQQSSQATPTTSGQPLVPKANPPGAPIPVVPPPTIKPPTASQPPAPSQPPTPVLPKSQPLPIAPPGPKPTVTTYSTKAASLGARAHAAWFQSNPYMQWNFPSPMNPAGQYNDMNYNPRTTAFEEGSGDSSFANLHNKNPNGNYTRDSMNMGGVTDLLIVPPADPRWTDEDPLLNQVMPISDAAVSDPRVASLAKFIDHEMDHQAKRLSTEDNPYIRDYSETRPLNNSITDSVNQPERDPNKPQTDHDEYGSIHQTQPRIRGIGPQGPLSQFDPTGQTADPFIEVVAPASADGTRFSLPSYKTQRPTPGLTSVDIIRDH